MLRKLILVGFLSVVLPQCDGRSMMTTRLLPQPTENFMQPHERQRYNDENMGLTAIKDKDLGACFINSFDPRWFPYDEDKQFFIDNFSCEKVDVNTDMEKLRGDYGELIATVCKDFFIFKVYAPPPLPPFLGDIVDPPKQTCEYHRAPQSGGNGSARKAATESAPRVNNIVPDNNSGIVDPGLQVNINNGDDMVTNGPFRPASSTEKNPSFINGDLDLTFNTGDLEPPRIGDLAPPMNIVDQSSFLNNGDHAPPMKSSSSNGDQAPPLVNVDLAPPINTVDQAPPLATGERAPPLFDGDSKAPSMITTLLANQPGNTGEETPVAENQSRKESIDIPTPPPPLWRQLFANGITFSPPEPDTRTPPVPMALRRWMEDNNNSL